MRYTVTILRRADADLQNIVDWLRARSPRGAAKWFEACEAAIGRLAIDAHRHAKAEEAHKLAADVRQSFFSTWQGPRYRIVYVIALDQVHVLRIRGPGQRPLRKRDLGL